MPLENTGAEERITRETMIGWIEHWGESYDDVRPDDGAVRLANRIIEYNEMTETVEDLGNPDAVYDELASGPLTGGVDAVPREATGPAG